MQASELVLRDVHVPAAPSWWPPAPGWWLVAAVVLLAIAVAWVIRHRRRLRLRAWSALFEQACRGEPASQAGAVSELLRRAARRLDTSADRLQGQAWLLFLDGTGKRTDFSEGAGRLLLDGGYRREVDAAEWDRARDLARTRYLELMAKRK